MRLHEAIEQAQARAYRGKRSVAIMRTGSALDALNGVPFRPRQVRLTALPMIDDGNRPLRGGAPATTTWRMEDRYRISFETAYEVKWGPWDSFIGFDVHDVLAFDWDLVP